MPNDLHAPLTGRARKTARRRSAPLAAAAIGLAVLVAAAAGLWVALVDDPHGGQPAAVVHIGALEPATTGATPGASRRGPAETAGRAPAGPELARDAAASLGRLGGAMRPSARPLDELLEPSAHGPVPRIGEDGLRPRDAYARPARSGAGDAPRAVIIVGGMGLSQTTSQQALRELPEEVTLAFAPYGASLERWSSRARDKGHEILLQLPLEPFGYPGTDPGPRTLLVDAPADEAQDHLAWHLSRIAAYAGVMSYMGGQFTADEEALRWLFAEIAGRGLYLVDDGTSPRSRIAAVGQAVGAPVVAADLVIDRARARAEVERELDRLEALARDRGLAVGVGSAFATTIEALAEWIPEAERRGLVIVPASAALGR